MRTAAQIAAGKAAKSTRSLRIPAKAGFKHPRTINCRGTSQMAYNIVAERDNETVRMRRNSSIIAIAKARVWASEGWEVTIVDDDENPLAPAEGQYLLNG